MLEPQLARRLVVDDGAGDHVSGPSHPPRPGGGPCKGLCWVWQPMFLTLMVIGLAGLVVMALPALTGVAHGHAAAPPHAGHALFAARTLGLLKGKSDQPSLGAAGSSLASTCLRFLLSPRIVFSLLALYGAFGNALEHALHLRPIVAAFAAGIPTLLVERFAVSPLWNLAFRFQGQPSSPLVSLVLEEAKAVTPFRNGRGVVAVVRDGRLVQFSAHLVERQSSARVSVGDRLLVEDVDSAREHLTVSVSDREL